MKMELTLKDKKLIEKYKKKVHNQYPSAYISCVGSGYYTIVQEEDNLEIKDILADYYLQPVNDQLKAWELAFMSVKTNQNLNRTHPLRIEGMNMEAKIARVEARRLKKEDSIESRKIRKHDNY
jgi:hypothetical protein